MEDWERRRTEERITKLEDELRELKFELTLEKDKRIYNRWTADSNRSYRRDLIFMAAAFVFAFAFPFYVIVSRLVARG